VNDAVLAHNVRTLLDAKRKVLQSLSTNARLADRITAFAGSPVAVLVHVVLAGGWVLYNSGLLGNEALDPFPFGLLAAFVSLEAIFISSFVLISQNRLTAAEDRRAELNLQVNLLTEHEVTQLVRLMERVADKVGVPHEGRVDTSDVVRDVDPQEVAGLIEATHEAAEAGVK
jgi:uncharacterized membrane protein